MPMDLREDVPATAERIAGGDDWLEVYRRGERIAIEMPTN